MYSSQLAISLMPGLIRASIVSKLLFPGTSAPGFLMILAAPLYALFAYVIILLPYQIAPVLTAMLLGGVAYRRMLRFCLAYSAIYVSVITPLNFLWWRWLGMFG